jgi:hypothetical protein
MGARRRSIFVSTVLGLLFSLASVAIALAGEGPGPGLH